MKENQKGNKTVDAKVVRKQSLVSFGGGILLLGIGIGATSFSYDNAKPGGSYTIYTGAIVLGAWFILKGLFGLVYPNFFVKRAEKRAVIDTHEIEDDSKDNPNKPVEFK